MTPQQIDQLLEENRRLKQNYLTAYERVQDLGKQLHQSEEKNKELRDFLIQIKDRADSVSVYESVVPYELIEQIPDLIATT